jgi:DNA-binding CsgD family transcriptional regulator
MTEETMDPNGAHLRPLLAVALASIVVGGATDLWMDQPTRWLTPHVVFEVTMIAGALLMATTLWLGWWRAEQSVTELRRALDARREERDAWSRSARAALEGLGEAMDGQFTVWGLTPSEREVALLLLKGYSHKQVAQATGRNERTARQHASSVYHKASLAGRAELAAFFFEDLMLPAAVREIAAGHPAGASAEDG